MLITNHTSGRLVLRPPGMRSLALTPDAQIYAELADRMTAENGYTSQLGYELYDTAGTTEDWSYYATGGLGFTFEIGDGLEFHPAFETVVNEYSGSGLRRGSNRAAYLIAMEAAGDGSKHAILEGMADLAPPCGFERSL